MTTKKNKLEISFFEMFEQFIHDSKTGKRLQPDGKKISAGTIGNYLNTLRLVKNFSEKNSFYIRLKKANYLTQRELLREKNYWKKFYRRFTDHLYKTCGHYDNYVSSIIKTIKTFFSWMNKDLSMNVGEFYKKFHLRNENIPILALLPEELNFFIYNKDFENSLSLSLRKTKDIFVIGCTVALRFCDLVCLERSNIRIINEDWYLNTRSKKTGAELTIKLPDYAIEILKKYFKIKDRKHLLPKISNTNLNKNIKKLLEKAGFTNLIKKIREKRGLQKELVNCKKNRSEFRICDLVSTHTMRRTAITTMLSLGVPEQIVRKISGHTAGSKEFYKYVFIAQNYMQQETGKMFDLLKERKLR
ncbi:MAG TPA: tyrosine-type recombinase/integrase [Puia sp.]|jgi:integrase|nr:tyrosine-type recombinase/integrase [Puia sp.]